MVKEPVSEYKVYNGSCGLNENDPHRLMFEYLFPSWWNCLGRIRCVFVEQGISLGGGL